MLELIFNVALVVAGLWLVLRWLQPRQRSGLLTVGEHDYQYRIGDTLIGGGVLRRLKGLELTLPKRLPHIYIDAHHGDFLRGPRYAFPEENKLKLEGGFNKYFQVYADPRFHREALAILTPDVMAVILDNLKDYDIEFEGRYLRIITHQAVFNHTARQEKMLLQSAQLVSEVAHKLKSWSRHSEQTAGSARMRIHDDSSTKIGKLSFSTTVLVYSIIFFALGAGFLSLGIWALNDPGTSDGGTPVILFICAFLNFPVFWLVAVLAQRRNWLDKTLNIRLWRNW